MCDLFEIFETNNLTNSLNYSLGDSINFLDIYEINNSGKLIEYFQFF